MIIRRHLYCGAAFLLLASGAIAQSPAKLAADLDPDSRARLPFLQRRDLGERGQKIYDTLPGRSAEGVLRGPLAFAAYNPAVAQALFDLHNAAVQEGKLDPHVRELAILVACRETDYSFEWNAHEPSAVKAGVDPKVIDAVRHGRSLAGIDDKDALVGAMDMVAVMSTYAVSGFFAIAVDEHMPPGRSELERLAR
jgi:alkylhydroperoxidase family enzyme